MIVDYSHDLLKNIHRGISLPNDGDTSFVQGPYEYWHYGCDGFNDRVCIINCKKKSYTLIQHSTDYICSGLGLWI